MLTNKNMIENIIFDLDGTLIDSSGDIIDCLKRSYELAGIKINVNIDESYIGPPLVEMLNSITPFLSKEQIDLVVKNFRSCYDESSYNKTILYDGVQELLENLRKIGIKMFIATNKPIKPTQKIITALKIDYFHDIVSIDSIEGCKLDKINMISYLFRKWNLTKSTTIMVSDSVSDIMVAHSYGLICVSVLNGYGKADEIKENKPDYILNEVKDLLDLVNDINKKIKN